MIKGLWSSDCSKQLEAMTPPRHVLNCFLLEMVEVASSNLARPILYYNFTKHLYE